MKRIALAIVLSYCSFAALAERYSVKQDGFGNYSAELVKQEEPAAEVVASELEPVPAAETAELISNPANQELQDHASTKDASSPNETESEKKLGVFERKYLEAEQQEKSTALENILQNRASPPLTETVIDEADYIDGDVLLERGGRRDSQASPYYTTVDIDGRPQNIYYDPAAVKKALELQKKGQPVLIGTISVDKNEALSLFLEREGIKHEIFNAKNH